MSSSTLMSVSSHGFLQLTNIACVLFSVFFARLFDVRGVAATCDGYLFIRNTKSTTAFMRTFGL